MKNAESLGGKDKGRLELKIKGEWFRIRSTGKV